MTAVQQPHGKTGTPQHSHIPRIQYLLITQEHGCTVFNNLDNTNLRWLCLIAALSLRGRQGTRRCSSEVHTSLRYTMSQLMIPGYTVFVVTLTVGEHTTVMQHIYRSL